MKTWIFTLYGASTSSCVASSSTRTEKRSNCSDSDIAEPPSMKACREFIQPSTMKRKYAKNWGNEFSWLVYDEDINGAFCRVCKQTTAESTTQAHRRCLGHKAVPELKESYQENESS